MLLGVTEVLIRQASFLLPFFGGVATVQMVDICELTNKQTGCDGYGNFAVSRPFFFFLTQKVPAV